MDRFEQFFDKNKKSFDLDMPAGDVKLRVFENLNNKRTKKRTAIYKMLAAASVILVICLGVLYFNNSKTNNAQPEVVKVNEETRIDTTTNKPVINETALVDVSNNRKEAAIKKRFVHSIHIAPQTESITITIQTNEVERNYQSLIDEQIKKLETLPVYVSNTERFESYKTRYEVLNNREEQLKALVKSNGMTKDFLDEMIAVYQDKLNLLLKLKLEIHEMNNSVARDSLAVKSSYFINL